MATLDDTDFTEIRIAQANANDYCIVTVWIRT